MWSHVIDRLGIWRLCSTKRAEQLRAQLSLDYRRHRDEVTEELPEVTEENVLGLMNGNSRPQLMALENCFRTLDGKSGAPQAHRSALDIAIEASPDGTGVTDYFQFR